MAHEQSLDGERGALPTRRVRQVERAVHCAPAPAALSSGRGAAFDAEVQELLRAVVEEKTLLSNGARDELVELGPATVPAVLRLLGEAADATEAAGADDADDRVPPRLLGVLSELVEQERGYGPFDAAVVDTLLPLAVRWDDSYDVDLVLALDPRLLPLLRERITTGPLLERLVALRAIDAMDGEGHTPAGSVLERAAAAGGADGGADDIVRHAASYHFAFRAFHEQRPLPAAAPELRLWVLAVAIFDESDGDPDVAARAELASRRNEARTLFRDAALTSPEMDVADAAVRALAVLPDPPLQDLLRIGRTATQPSARMVALEEFTDLASDGLGQPMHATARAAYLGALADPDDDVRYTSAEGLHVLSRADPGVLPALMRVLDERPEAREGAAWALQEFGKEAGEAADALARVALDESAQTWDRVAALEALVDVAERVDHPAVKQAAIAGPAPLRLVAIDFLAKIPWPPAPTARALLDLTRDPDPEVRVRAVRAADGLTQFPDEAVPALITALADPDGRVVAAAAEALVAFRPLAADAMPALTEALRTQDGDARLAVLRSVRRLSSHAEPARAALIDLLRAAPDRVTAGAVLRILSILEWVPEQQDVALIVPFVPEVAGGRGDTEWTAIKLLGKAGPDAVAAVPRLLALARLEKQNKKGLLLRSLGRISPCDPEVVAFLVDALRGGEVHYSCGGSWNVPEDAAEALGTMRPVAWHALPDLEAALAFEERMVRRAAAAAIESMTGAPPVLPELPADDDDARRHP